MNTSPQKEHLGKLPEKGAIASSITDAEAIEKAQACYTPKLLAIYNFLVLRFFSAVFWRCPRKKLLAQYQQHMSQNHLDCGVGTGFFVESCANRRDARFGLLDLNPNSLEVAHRHLRRFKPLVFQRNILEPLDLDCEPFDSVGLNYLFHCLPGEDLSEKSCVFDHIIPYMNEDATVFGATLLGNDIQKPLLAIPLMNAFNKRGIFNNRNDSLSDLMEQLSKRFRSFNVEVSGCVVLFWAKGLRDSVKPV